MPELNEKDVTFAGFASRAIVTDGDPSSPAFLLLHGFSDSADGWRRLQRRLAAAGHRTLAVDQPSQGRADRLRDGEPVIPQFVEFAADAARATADGEPVIVVGNSLGGAHALLLAQHHPDLVRAVVAISPASFDHPNWFGILDDDSRVASALRTRRQAIAAQDDAAGSPTRVQRLLRRQVTETVIRNIAFGAPWRAPAGFVRDMRRQFRDPERRRAIRDLGMRIPPEYIHGDPIDLGAISMPVLALWGVRDRLVKVSSRRTLEAGIPDLEFVELPNIGHMPQLEAPGRTTKHILRFAARVAAADPDPAHA